MKVFVDEANGVRIETPETMYDVLRVVVHNHPNLTVDEKRVCQDIIDNDDPNNDESDSSGDEADGN